MSAFSTIRLPSTYQMPTEVMVPDKTGKLVRTVDAESVRRILMTIYNTINNPPASTATPTPTPTPTPSGGGSVTPVVAGVTSFNGKTGDITISAGANITISVFGNNFVIAAVVSGAPVFRNKITPTNPSVDNQNFVLPSAPINDSLQLFLRGTDYPPQMLFPDGVDYTLSGADIAMNNALTGTYALLAYYQES